MRKFDCRVLIGLFVALIAALTLSYLSSISYADEVPGYMEGFVGSGVAMTKAEADQENVLALDHAMMPIYEEALTTFQKNFLTQHPVIMALFTNGGGRLILYRPGKEPIDAPPVPIRYQLYKSVGHSSLATFELAASHLKTVEDQSWKGKMVAFRAANQTALDSIDTMDMSADERANQRTILRGNIKFMDACISKGTYTFAEIQAYAHEERPYLAKNVNWAATLQVEHWMKVLKDWKEMVGADWDKTYGVSNSMFVTRQNNVLFGLLAQFFGRDTINTRLMIYETTSFSVTPDEMFSIMMRTIADRSVGEVFFGNYYLMDYELMGAAAFRAIAVEDPKYGLKVFLPPLVPYGSHEWPFKTDASQAKGPATMEEIK